MAREEPCKCHNSFAYITPTHSGHCCFAFPFSTCHSDEVAEWVKKRDKLRLAGKEKNDE